MRAISTKLLVIALVFIPSLIYSGVNSAKILVLHNVCACSHALLMRKLAGSLTSRGHQVDIIKWKETSTALSENSDTIQDNITLTTLAMDNREGQYFVLTQEKEAAFTIPEEILWNTNIDPIAILFSPVFRGIFPFFGAHCDTLFGNSKLRKDLKARNYDVAVIDLTWNECSIGYAREVLKIPVVVGFWGISPTTLQADTRTTFLTSSHSPPMKLVADVQNPILARAMSVLMNIISQAVMLIYHSYIHASMKKYIPGSKSPLELHQGLNGVLLNSDPSIEEPRLLPPNHIYVGGMLIDREQSSLERISKELLDWMNNSDGVILFSLGASLDSKAAPKHILSSFLEAFSRIPHRVLFQYKGNQEHLKIPPNVKLVGWIPQQAVLAHPKMKLFVNHCGHNGLIEATWNAVPIVCMPIVNDGEDNMFKVVAKGIGLGLNKDTLTPENIFKALQQVIGNRKYKKNAIKLSVQMRDVPEAPLDRASNFIEYLIRHKGADHLRPSRPSITFVEYFYLDVIGILVLFIVILGFSLNSLVPRLHYSKK